MNLNPLHSVILSFWYRLTGDDILHYRLFSVLIFILTLPFLFFLARKLFRSDQIAWIATSLYSVSPFIHLFAQPVIF
ncbi:MAG TPA: phospholipid carrier-dependent glycosyltransferase [Mariniphaga anaerophila]|uniref:Phospholipid carrier-dependent glycosyltransferase n=1 Tax=Mariniphaga anaerophila TaxID=1484053 RepID=A0A831LYZ5_9BACT|nr:phospholipid carrier-dependent glycosyltransferase [Mariniphaga anaerophila]